MNNKYYLIYPDDPTVYFMNIIFKKSKKIILRMEKSHLLHAMRVMKGMYIL